MLTRARDAANVISSLGGRSDAGGQFAEQVAPRGMPRMRDVEASNPAYSLAEAPAMVPTPDMQPAEPRAAEPELHAAEPELHAAEPELQPAEPRAAEPQAPQPQGLLPQTPGQAGPERSQWERLGLGPNVELHIRRPLSRLEQRRVERLITIARQVLDEDQS